MQKPPTGVLSRISDTEKSCSADAEQLLFLLTVAQKYVLIHEPVPNQIQNHIPGAVFQELVGRAGNDHQLGILVIRLKLSISSRRM